MEMYVRTPVLSKLLRISRVIRYQSISVLLGVGYRMTRTDTAASSFHSLSRAFLFSLYLTSNAVDGPLCQPMSLQSPDDTVDHQLDVTEVWRPRCPPATELKCICNVLSLFQALWAFGR